MVKNPPANAGDIRDVGSVPGGSDSKESACNVGDPGWIPGLGRSPGEGNGNPLQYSCPENPMDWGAWWATVHWVAKNRTWLSDFAFTFLSMHYGGFPGNSLDKESICNVGHASLLPGLKRSPGGGHGNPLQYSCLENPMDRGAWWATVQGVTKSWTRLKRLSMPAMHYWVFESFSVPPPLFLGKNWIYLERYTLQRQNVDHFRGQEQPFLVSF